MKQQRMPFIITNREMNILFDKSYRTLNRYLSEIREEYGILKHQHVTIWHVSRYYNIPVPKLEDAILNNRQAELPATASN